MKNIILLSTEKDFLHSLWENIRTYYEKLIIRGTHQNIQIIRSSIYQYNKKTNTFLNWETFDWSTWVSLTNIKIDLVWYKSNSVNYLTRIIEEKNIFINDTRFVELVNDKYITSLYSPEYSPKTLLLDTDWIEDFSQRTQQDIIIKPNWWSGGKWVEKISIQDLKKIDIQEYNNYIIQETLDSSPWIPWVVEGIHDIRFVMFWTELMSHVLIRTPPKKDFRCNITAGWATQYIPISGLPEELVQAVNIMLKKIQVEFWNVFGSIDLTRANEKYYLIEYNSSPWIRSFSFKKELEDEYYTKTIEFFQKQIQS